MARDVITEKRKQRGLGCVCEMRDQYLSQMRMQARVSMAAKVENSFS